MVRNNRNPFSHSSSSSYLPGITRIIHGCDDKIKDDNASANWDNAIFVSILELGDVVLFPGYSLPLRLQDPQWTRYLSQKISNVRSFRNLQELDVIIGIVPRSDESADLRNRIGTLVVVESVNTSDADENIDENDGYRYDEIILTVKGIQRFVVLKCINDDSIVENKPNCFEVERLVDDCPVTLPASVRCLVKPSSCVRSSGNLGSGLYSRLSQGQITRSSVDYLKTICHAHVWNHWPEVLFNKIRKIILTSPKWSGIAKLPSFRAVCCGEGDEYADPAKITFWLATNMPFSSVERAKLLGMRSLFEMASYIFHRLKLGERSNFSNIRCGNCRSVIAKSDDLFNLEGITDGISGSYVNQHGVVHQTVTLRESMHSAVLLYGSPETKDSWFPGYAWTITYCRSCFQHLVSYLIILILQMFAWCFVLSHH